MKLLNPLFGNTCTMTIHMKSGSKVVLDKVSKGVVFVYSGDDITTIKN